MHLPVAVAGWSSVGLGVGATVTGGEVGVGDWVGAIDVTVGAGVEDAVALEGTVGCGVGVEVFTAYAIQLARSFWPGPMTLILKRSELAKDFITGNQNTVGIRIPDNSLALGLLEAFHQKGGAGIAAPSANRFGQVSPTTAAAVEEELSEYLTDLDLVLDGGTSEVGLESTIIDCTLELPRILRPGAITIAMIEEVTGLKISDANISNQENIRVSGSLENHYAPKAKVILDQVPTAGAGFIALAPVQTPPDVVRLAAPDTVEEFARTLYSALREGDHQNLETIYISQPAGDGLAIAIRDRLARSARGR